MFSSWITLADLLVWPNPHNYINKWQSWVISKECLKLDPCLELRTVIHIDICVNLQEWILKW